LRRAVRVKFVRPLRPGERLQLRLERGGKDRVDFVFAVDMFGKRETIATGTLHFAGGQQPG
jgi:3-hydroxymyristoyl/3-hydroxydecanoyl-(acyl carrier protein) dehydratase